MEQKWIEDFQSKNYEIVFLHSPMYEIFSSIPYPQSIIQKKYYNILSLNDTRTEIIDR